MTTQELRITRGFPGSGKSTYAKAWVDEAPGRVRVNRDDLRAMLFGRTGVLANTEEEAVTTAQQSQVRSLLRNGRSVIVDDTNLVLRFARVWADIAAQTGSTFSVQDFNHITLDQAIAWDAARSSRGERGVGEDVIRKLHKRFPPKGWKPVTPLAAKAAAEVTVEPYVGDRTLPPAYIFDVDGTLAHMHNRSPYDYDRCGEDLPDEETVRMAQVLFNDGFDIVVMSGRTDSHRHITEAWLREHQVPFQGLFMRETGDDRNDAIIKAELFDRHVRNTWNVRGVFDDRLRVCRMWHNNLQLPLFRVGDPDADF